MQKAKSERTHDEPIHKRIEQLKQQIRDATGEQSIFGTMPGCPPEMEEAFLEQVLVFHTAGRRALGLVLKEAGMSLPSPDELNDAELPPLLWELIGELAVRSVVLEFTDHLSDRELYAFLWSELFEEASPLLAAPQGAVYHVDPIGSGSDEDMQIYLKYYADAKTRQRYARDFPDVRIPEHADPPYKRDHLLPGHEERPPF